MTDMQRMHLFRQWLATHGLIYRRVADALANLEITRALELGKVST